jgi:asparagine synthase (glutamine-hydrolysing)
LQSSEDIVPSFVAILSKRSCEESRARKELVERLLKRRWPELRSKYESGPLALWTKPNFKPRILMGGRLVVVGELLAKDEVFEANPSSGAAPTSAAATAAWLMGNCWGRYVAFVHDQSFPAAAIVRDPSGAVEALVAEGNGLAVVTPHLPRWLAHAVNGSISPDFAALATAVIHPLVATHQSLLHHVTLVPAGGVCLWNGRLSRPRVLWTPPRPEPVGTEAGAEMLRDAVLRSCKVLRQRHERITVELSGGLDSSIVLGALASLGTAQQISCVNFATGEAAGDERALARAAAAMWKVDLKELQADHRALDYSFLAAAPVGAVPRLYGLDNILEAGMTKAMCESGSTVSVTGQGGDAVFYQFPSLLSLVDLSEDQGPRAAFSPAVLQAARRTNSTIWRAWREMLRHACGFGRGQAPFDLRLLGTAAKQRLELEPICSPWIVPGRLPPGKEEQLEAIANGQIFNQWVPRRAAAEVRHPLLTQPVIEACMAIPTYELAYGSFDRALARHAFSDLIPRQIAKRRGKGETSSYHYRGLAENLPFLRERLIEGRLAAHGLLDREALEESLQDDVLLQSDAAAMALPYASLEAWAREWGL